MGFQTQVVLRVGVPTMQDLQEWDEPSQSVVDPKQLTLETVELAPWWLVERRVNVKWKPLPASSDTERRSSICLQMRHISASPAVVPLSEYRMWYEIHQLTNSVQRQDNPHLQPFVESENSVLSDMMRMTSCKPHLLWRKGKIQNWSRSDHGLDFGFLYRKFIIADGIRAGIPVVTGRQHNGQLQLLVLNYMHYEGCVIVTSKPHVNLT